MSCDYAVWHTPHRLTPEQAGALYLRLCGGEFSEVSAHPGISAFHGELTTKHPEIDDVPEEQLDDHELCPWSAAFDRSEGHIIMSCIWPKADYVGKLVENLAAKHGLVFYDPQSERVSYPGEAASRGPWWKLW